MKRRNLILFIVLCICLGGLSFWHGASAKVASASEVENISADELKNVIITAYQNYQTEVNVMSYCLYEEKDSDMIQSVMEDVLNETPEIFYAGRGFSRASLEDTGQIVQLRLTYADKYFDNGVVNEAKIERVDRRIDAAVKKALANVNESMTDVEKALVLHDYLIGLITYNDNSSRNSRLTVEGAFLEKKANCQGYSGAYNMLLEKAGIPAECFSSQEMDHMWNLVQINSKWYHVDVTWDDPLHERNAKEQYGVVLHENFLLSDAGIRKSGHEEYNTGLATDKQYDSAYWRKIKSGFWYQSGKFVYADSKGIYTRKSLTDDKARCLKKQTRAVSRSEMPGSG